MCGIAGFIGRKNPQLLKSMLNGLKHRGPDDESLVEFDNVSLGYRRLAVIDLETGNQPFFNEDQSLCLFYNGEIYNFQDLRRKLSDHRFRSQSDGEVIVHGFEEWGEDVFAKLNGMFAIALYDLRKKRLFLVRDHFGIKPLYYYFDSRNQRLLFASEIRALFQDPKTPKVPNEAIIYQYLVHRVHDHSEETFFAGIKKLLPGEIMKISLEKGDLKINKRKFWSLDFNHLNNRTHVSERELAEKFAKLLQESVRLRLVADVPVGVCLSGGLDSSTISILVDELSGEPQKTFSAVFPGEKNNEREFIDAVNRQTSAQSHLVYPQSSELFNELEDLVRVQEEPFISSGPYAQYCVMREAANEVKVLLDGQGGDELLAGYDPYFLVYLRQLLQDKKLCLFARELLAVRTLLFKFARRRWQQHSTINVFSLLNSAFCNRAVYCAPPSSNFKQRLHEDVFKYSLPALLRYEDKNSAAFSLESRVPFLDPNLVEFVFSLPNDLIIKDGINKYILRQAMKDKLPPKVYNRRWKVGFTTPEDVWFRQEKDRILEIFQSRSFRRRPYWNAEKIINAFNRFLQGAESDSMLFWRFLNTEVWLRVFID
jgi:asparagine synthase (glutamine-hydrolysing)